MLAVLCTVTLVVWRRVTVHTPLDRPPLQDDIAQIYCRLAWWRGEKRVRLKFAFPNSLLQLPLVAAKREL